MRERRSEVRMLCADLVEVCWEDEEHQPQQATAVLEDISRAGACLQFEVPLPTGTSVRIACGGEHLQATVRYCVYREIGYVVGVQFEAGSQWSPQEFHPEHMLDPLRLTRPGKKPNKLVN